jgi:hypothetical protein
MEDPGNLKRQIEAEELPFADTTTTPGWIRTWVYREFPITFEPLETENFIPLVQGWQGFSFVHPPHEEAQLWCEKAVLESQKGNPSVLLLPAVFNSMYWRGVIYPGATEIRILACPVKRPGAKKQIVSQMALVIFAGRDGLGERDNPPIFVVEPQDWETKYYKRARNLARFSIKK